jgi:IS30 family transposase
VGAAQLVSRARGEGVALTGDEGLLTSMVREVLQAGLEVEMVEHLGYEAYDPPGRGSLWFIDAGSVTFIEGSVNRRYLTQDDRIEIADGLASGEPVKSIAARIGKSYQSIYRGIARNGKPDGRYQPWYAHGQAHLRRRRPRSRRASIDDQLRAAIAGKLAKHWSPAQISRWLRRRWPQRTDWHLCHETI